MCLSDPVSIVKFLTPKNVVAMRKVINGIGRPVITMADPNTPEDAKRYAAAREFSTEMIGLGIILSTGTFFERAGGYLYAKAIGVKMTKKKWHDLEKLAINPITDFKDKKMLTINSITEFKDKRIKAAILISSLVGTIAEGAILTPLLNNLVLNKFLDVIFKHDYNKEELKKLSVNQSKLAFKEKSIFNTCNNFFKAKPLN